MDVSVVLNIKQLEHTLKQDPGSGSLISIGIAPVTNKELNEKKSTLKFSQRKSHEFMLWPQLS